MSRLGFAFPRGFVARYHRAGMKIMRVAGHIGIGSVRHITILAVAACCLAVPALAAPPPDADPSMAPWFNNLRQPWTNALCCSMADCRPVDSRINGNHYEAFIEGQWRNVPNHLILNRSDNPTGRAVACWTPQVGILCFVRAPES